MVHETLPGSDVVLMVYPRQMDPTSGADMSFFFPGGGGRRVNTNLNLFPASTIVKIKDVFPNNFDTIRYSITQYDIGVQIRDFHSLLADSSPFHSLPGG